MSKNKRQNKPQPTVSQIVRVKSQKEAKDVATRLVAEGYMPTPYCKPGRYNGGGNGLDNSLSGIVQSQLKGGGKITDNGKKERKDIPLVYASTGGEVMKDNEHIGTKGLGWMEWGVGNLVPNIVAYLTRLLPQTAAGIKFNTDLTAGLGPKPMYRYAQYLFGNITNKEINYSDAGALIRGRINDYCKTVDNEETGDRQRNFLNQEIESLEADYNSFKETQKGVDVFLANNNLDQIYLQLASDFQTLGGCFVEIQLEQKPVDEKGNLVPTSLWKPKVTGIAYRSALTCRLERMDEKGRINYVYVSNRWLDQPFRETGQAEPDIDALPCLDPNHPVESLRTLIQDARDKDVAPDARPCRFILPLFYPTTGRPYYPVPAWHSIFGGDIFEYCASIIEDRNTRKKNANIVGRIIYIHQEYLQSLYRQSQQSDKPRQIGELRDEVFQQVNDWLSNKDNSGQSLVAFTFMDANGNEHDSWRIVEIESASKNVADAQSKELQEISSIIFFAMGLDSKLVGNTPGDTSSGGGTDLRERYLVKQAQIAPTQQLILTPLEIAAAINEWDPHLVWRIAHEVLTTLDRSHTGLTEGQQNA